MTKSGGGEGGRRIVGSRGEAHLPNLAAFLTEVRREEGASKLLIDLAAVTYVDSASIGCLMDIRRLLEDKGGVLKLSGLQPRVETMISMTGVNRIIDIHREEKAALASFADRGQGKSDA